MLGTVLDILAYFHFIIIVELISNTPEKIGNNNPILYLRMCFIGHGDLSKDYAQSRDKLTLGKSNPGPGQREQEHCQAITILRAQRVRSQTRIEKKGWAQETFKSEINMI